MMMHSKEEEGFYNIDIDELIEILRSSGERASWEDNDYNKGRADMCEEILEWLEDCFTYEEEE